MHDLEEGHLGLSEALARYEQGVKHLKHCYELLTQAERKIELLSGVAEDGTPITQPLDDASQPADRPGRRRPRKAAGTAPAHPPPPDAGAIDQ